MLSSVTCPVTCIRSTLASLLQKLWLRACVDSVETDCPQLGVTLREERTEGFFCLQILLESRRRIQRTMSSASSAALVFPVKHYRRDARRSEAVPRPISRMLGQKPNTCAAQKARILASRLASHPLPKSQEKAKSNSCQLDSIRLHHITLHHISSPSSMTG